ncbi:hypothetical protein [Crinalium epipsammum]|nr:hypothetical protein [Crinalium epipsammum]
MQFLSINFEQIIFMFNSLVLTVVGATLLYGYTMRTVFRQYERNIGLHC